MLERINLPSDLKKLSILELQVLCSEIRQRILEVVSQTGGHLASSLGAVELIVALHYCLDTPRDKIIFDVGHQAYAHKIITGRNKNFSTLRQFKGISGFPDFKESQYDVFTTGHSSNALSLGLGLACARDYLGEDFKIVVVIGDGSLSGGLCFEGLNNTGHLQKDILVILNTNELSIAPNVGALSTYINKIISLPLYNRFRSALENFVKTRLPKGSRLLKIANKFEKEIKGLFIPGVFFEELGFRYFGPLDGHNLELLISTLNNILNLKGPRILHVVTKKGKGYSPAEQEPIRFHSAVPFKLSSGEPLFVSSVKTYTQVFSQKLVELARKNKRIVAITAAMPEGTGLDKFRDQFPERFFDVGIAEAHAVSFAGGLAKLGLKPVVAIYSTFLQRAYDQLIEDIALQELAVVFVLDRAGIVGEDGATHQGIFDLVYLGSIPNFVILAPANDEELELMLEFAINLDKPTALRYPKSQIPQEKFFVPEKIKLATPQRIKEGKDFLVFALGSMVYPTYQAIKILEEKGLTGTLVNCRFVKPLDLEEFKEINLPTFSIEEGILDGGLGSRIQSILERKIFRIGLPCEFIPHGKRELLLEKYGLTSEKIAETILRCLK